MGVRTDRRAYGVRNFLTKFSCIYRVPTSPRAEAPLLSWKWSNLQSTKFGLSALHMVTRRGSTPVSTVLRKSVTFFITNIFLIIKTLSGLESGQYPVWMTRKSRKGDFKEWKSKTFPGRARLRTPLEPCAFSARLGNRSVFILDPRLVTVVRFALICDKFLVATLLWRKWLSTKRLS